MAVLKTVVTKLNNVYSSSYLNNQPKNPSIILPASTSNRVITYIGYHLNQVDSGGTLYDDYLDVLYALPKDKLATTYKNAGQNLILNPTDLPLHQHMVNGFTSGTDLAQKSFVYSQMNMSYNTQIVLPAGYDLIGMRYSSQTGTSTPNSKYTTLTLSYLE